MTASVANPYRSSQELRALAEATAVTDGSINELVNNALGYVEKYRYSIASQLKEAAYMDYCNARFLLFDVIPRHSDYAMFSSKKKHSSFYQSYMELRSLVEKDNMINDLETWLDNRVKNYEKKSQESSTLANDTNGSSLNGSKSNGSNGHHHHYVIKGKASERLVNRNSISALSSSGRPASLEQTDFSDPSGTSDLLARFEKLRPPSSREPSTTGSVNSVNTSPAADRTARNRYDTHIDSSTSLKSHNGGSYSDVKQNGSRSTEIRKLEKRPTVIFPKTTLVNTDKLLEYMEKAPESVLILDVRSRSDFSLGHIKGFPNIVCIEPASLRDGMNDVDLEDTLVMCPEDEQEVFSRRHEFELIVYYDWDSKTNQYRGGPVTDYQQVTLYYLTRALYDFAFSKPLKRPPCLLVGGYDAWLEDVYNVNSATIRSRNNSSVDLASSSVVSGGGAHPNAVTNDHLTRTRSISYNTKKIAPPVAPQPPPQHIVSRPHGRSRKGSVATKPDYARDYNDFFKAMPQMYSLHEDYHQDYYHDNDPRNSSSPVISPPAARKPSFGGDQISLHHSGSTSSLHSLDAQISQHHQHQHHLTHTAPPSYPPPPPPHAAPAPPMDTYPGGLSMHNVPIAARPSQDALKVLAAEFTTGLQNLGNTCYMNCIIQCLAGTPPLAIPFADGSYRRWVNVNSKLGFKGVLAQRFAELVQTLLRPNVSCVGPVALKELSGRLRDQFNGYEQQDCQEFLTFILDGLHEDLNSNGNKDRLKELTPAEEARREHMSVRVASAIEWERYLKNDFSLIVDTVQGQYQSQLRCLTCNTTSTTYNAFSFLSLPIPLVATRGQPVSLYDCFNTFTAEEILDGDDAWLCPKCKKRRRTSKRLRISRLPSLLIIHLKRFHHNYAGNSDKLETFVTFPTSTGLDLTSYWPPYQGDDEVRLEKLPLRGQNPPFIYDLYGVANHFGTLKGGHYTAFVRKGRKGWCLFDDLRITQNIPPDHVMTKHAYVLFFQRRHTVA